MPLEITKKRSLHLKVTWRIRASLVGNRETVLRHFKRLSRGKVSISRCRVCPSQREVKKSRIPCIHLPMKSAIGPLWCKIARWSEVARQKAAHAAGNPSQTNCSKAPAASASSPPREEDGLMPEHFLNPDWHFFFAQS